jgi:hypothetical protein
MKIILYHGTSAENAKRIEKKGFIPDKKYNWRIKSKKGFVYLSLAYAPFYAMNCMTNKLAMIKVEVDTKDLFPDDDYVMLSLGKKVYTQKELNKVSLSKHKDLWEHSLHFMGNASARPKSIKIVKVTYFDGRYLIFKCDPTITPINYMIMGGYYEKLSEWISDGKDIMKFPSFMGGFKA